MILTYKIKHNRDFKAELNKAMDIAKFAINNRDKLSTKYVSHFGLKSAISNQILRKYGRDKKCKEIKNVNLIIPNQGIKIKENNLRIVPLKFELDIKYIPKFNKVNQIEIDKNYLYISVSKDEKESYQPKSIIGLDRNTTGHIAVCANLSSGKILKLGKSAKHLRNKYCNIRKQFQSKGLLKCVKQIKDKEARIIKDLNHKISKRIIDECLKNKSILIVEQLKGIRNNKKHSKSFNGNLNSWSFYQLETFLKYKAKLNGVTIEFINPKNTSKECSKCGDIGTRINKIFKCKCGHVEHADVNAAFNIGKRYVQLFKERDLNKSNTGDAHEEMIDKSN